MATPEDGPAVVIKRRTRRRAEREQLVCRIAHMFAGAAPPVVPAVALQAPLVPGLTASRTKHCTVELMQRVLPPSSADEQHSVAPGIKATADLLANSLGCANLATAYLCSPHGRALLPQHLPAAQFQCSDEWTDAHFAEVLRTLDQQSFEMLWLLHVITQQEDAGAPNLLLRVSASGSSFELVLTDSCDALPGPPCGTIPNPCGCGSRFEYYNGTTSSSDSSNSSGSSSGSNSSSDGDPVLDDMLLLRGGNDLGEFEYPLILEIWLVEQQPSAALIDCILQICQETFENLLECSDAVSDEGKVLTYQRLVALKELAAGEPMNLTLREIAFMVVPAWGAAWAACESIGHIGPIREISDSILKDKRSD